MRFVTLSCVAALALATGATAEAAVIAMPNSALGTSIGDTPSNAPFSARQLVTTPGNPVQWYTPVSEYPIPDGYASYTSLNAISGLKVLKDWTGVPVKEDFANGDMQHILTFTDPALPALRITMAGLANWQRGGSVAGGFDGATDTRLALQGQSGSVKIEFGSYDGTAFTLGSVSAAGIDTGDSDGNNGITAVFKDLSGNPLSTQFGGNPGNWGRAGTTSYFFGSAAGGIASIDLAFSNDNWKDSGLDNLAFTAIPEPTSLATLGLCGLLALRRRSR